MGNIEHPVEFCNDCPFANGILSSDTIFSTPLEAQAPHPPLEFQFEDSEGKRSRIVSTPELPGVDSTMDIATAQAVIEKIRGCHGVTQRKALFGLLTKTACGAFPDQNPKNAKIAVSSYGYLYDDF